MFKPTAYAYFLGLQEALRTSTAPRIRVGAATVQPGDQLSPRAPRFGHTNSTLASGAEPNSDFSGAGHRKDKGTQSPKPGRNFVRLLLYASNGFGHAWHCQLL